jgi:hypothetical protein
MLHQLHEMKAPAEVYGGELPRAVIAAMQARLGFGWWQALDVTLLFICVLAFLAFRVRPESLDQRNQPLPWTQIHGEPLLS